jgi:Amino acid synthesis
MADARPATEKKCCSQSGKTSVPLPPHHPEIGGGKAVIGANVKVAAAGSSLDVPLGHKDESWSFPHFDTITVSIADAPRPDEIVVVIAIADGGRLRNRCGTEPIR